MFLLSHSTIRGDPLVAWEKHPSGALGDTFDFLPGTNASFRSCGSVSGCCRS